MKHIDLAFSVLVLCAFLFGMSWGYYRGYELGAKHGAMGAQMQCQP